MLEGADRFFVRMRGLRAGYNVHEVIVMEEVLTRPKQSYVFDRKLTDKEIRELVENYDYTPYWDDDPDNDEGTELDPVYDKYGNPTESLIRAMYETENGLTTPTTLDELLAWVDSL